MSESVGETKEDFEESEGSESYQQVGSPTVNPVPGTASPILLESDSSGLESSPVKMSDKPTVVKPLRGGIDQSDGDGVVPWTGGNPSIDDREMTSFNCLRPIKHKDIAPIRKEASEGLDSTRHLGMPGAAGSTITFATWMRYVTRHLQRCGMDSLFYIPKKGTTTPVHFICTEWSKISMDDVEHFLETTTLDRYDRQNMEWSGLFLQESMSLELWTSIEPELGLNVDGVRVLTAVILQYQASASITIRNLTNRLSEMSLKKTPGENVETLCNQIFDIASQIEGLGETPSDLASMIVARFLESSSQAFSSEAMTIYRKTKSIASPLTWTNAIRELKATYSLLKAEKMWKAIEPPKQSDSETVLAAMQKEIAELKRRGKHDKDEQENPSQDSSSSNKTNPFKSTPAPKEGESNVKTIGGKECTFCGKCKRWTWGDKRHSTEEHRSAAEIKAAKKEEGMSSAANTAASPETEGAHTLAMSSGFWCQSLSDF